MIFKGNLALCLQVPSGAATLLDIIVWTPHIFSRCITRLIVNWKVMGHVLCHASLQISMIISRSKIYNLNQLKNISSFWYHYDDQSGKFRELDFSFVGDETIEMLRLKVLALANPSSTAETSYIKVIRPLKIYWLKLELVRVDAKTPSLTEITYAPFSCTLYVEITIHYSIELADKVSLVISMGLDLNSKNQPSSQ